MRKLKSISKYLINNNLTITTAESITGGQIASKLVDIPGISRCYNYGFVTYSNEAKEKILKVRHSTLESYGAVSHETAREMAAYARKVSDADIAIASTGIAGPGGGSKNKPVGLTYVSCAIDDYVITRKYIFKGSRNKIRNKTVNAAIKLLDDCLKKYLY